jgi:hypothetical protein
MKHSAFFLGSALLAFVSVSTSAHATNVISNGGFSTGDFTGWTIFTTPNGSLGPSQLPRVSTSNVTGTNAAQFQVGVSTTNGIESGGGLIQTISTTSGTLVFSADIAVQDTYRTDNADAGTFSVFLNGVEEDSIVYGKIYTNTSIFGHLNFSAPVSAGAQTLEILITRHAFNNLAYGYGGTPFQFVTGVSATGVDLLPPPPYIPPTPPTPPVTGVPEPSSWAMMLIGLASVGFARYRRVKLNALACATPV